MNKFTSMVLAGAVCASFAFGADFSKQSNDDLIKMSGVVAPKDFPDYKIELHKRMQTMTKEQAKDFHKKLEEAMEKNTDKMTLKEFRERKQAIKKAMEEKRKTMTKKELKESGLEHKHHKHHKCDMDEKNSKK
ncbi:DUF1104 domain-containing protein [Helicobacter sp. 11S02596-1]|uniref:DUF1104 domain-containing protein n=1 Tax=Helicobacter sp. 11S02596-1 TaxID=1476194 RepID=UPI000BA72B88|nr:DUF1104 domain-containing protein [Helicobacter sp. 11S02596-1]PAF42510.1 hypothetical protein BJI48_06850 [Helicobacter sp. 11S02596-1]